MSMIRAILLIMVLLLAACGGSPAPTATPPAPTATHTTVPLPTQPIQAGDVLPTSAFESAQVTIVAAQPGTVIPASDATIQPVNSQPFRFDSVVFTQTGGVTGTNLEIIVYGDGRFTRNGVEGRTSAETIANIAALITAFDFFRVEGQFMSPRASADTFTYTLTVNYAGQSRSIRSQDGATPDGLFVIYDVVRALGV